MGMKLAHSLKRGKNKMTDLIQLGKQAKSASSQLALLEKRRKNVVHIISKKKDIFLKN